MTMDCSTCRDRLLEADLPDLRGEGDPAVAAHLHACLACRAFASAILAAEAERERGGRTAAAARPASNGWRSIGAVLAVALAAFLVVFFLTRPAPARTSGPTAASAAPPPRRP
jgi:hypothetical protein